MDPLRFSNIEKTMRISTDVLVLCLIATLLALSGCASVGLHHEDFMRPTVRSELGVAGVTDRSPEFGQTFCRNYARFAEPGAGPCERWLAGMPPAWRSELSAVAPATRGNVGTLVVIPGIFGECVSTWVTPYSHDYRYLEQSGYRVHVVNVTGRGSSEVNARIIHEFFATHASDRVVVLAFSKGVTDFMFAAAQPQAKQWAGRVAAFVSVAGVVNGTPLASRGERLYNRLLAKLPLSLCPPSDGGGVSSLTYQAALKTSHAFAQVQKPYSTYSVAAIAEDGAVNPLLRMFYDLLSRHDGRNDGQVLTEDTIIPRSIFLGMFKADHWSIALPFEDSKADAMRPLGINNHFPRRALITSMLEFVNQQLTGEQR